MRREFRSPASLPSVRLLVLALACAGLVSACSSKKPAAAPSAPGLGVQTGEAGGSGPGALTHPTVPLPSAPGPAPAAAPVILDAAGAQKSAMASLDLLEAGEEDKAIAEIQRALNLDPTNKLALSLQKQITADPVETYGKESFPYRVQGGETLSRIAGRFLGDIYQFYGLARYNDLKVPRQLSGGQVIRIPGKAPPPPPPPSPRQPREVAAPPVAPPVAEAPPAPPPPPAAPPAPPPPAPGDTAMNAARAAERRGDLPVALSEYQRAAGLGVDGAAAKVQQVRRQLITKHTSQARSAFAKQDLDGAIANWDRVLQLDSGNDTAALERRKAVELRDKLKGLK